MLVTLVRILLVLLLAVCPKSFADEIITDINDEKSTPILNEELRKLDVANRDLKTDLAALTTTVAGISNLSLRTKVGSFTRDLSTATGTQAITGVGFQPKAVLFFGVLDGSAVSWGMDDGTTSKGILYRGASGPMYATVAIQFQLNGTPDQQYASISALGADGFTLSWTKQNSPTGTATIQYLAIGEA